MEMPRTFYLFGHADGFISARPTARTLLQAGNAAGMRFDAVIRGGIEEVNLDPMWDRKPLVSFPARDVPLPPGLRGSNS